MKVARLFAIAVCLGAVAPAVAATGPWQEFRLPGTDFVVSTPGKPTMTEDGVDRDGVAAETAQLKLARSPTGSAQPDGPAGRRAVSQLDPLRRAIGLRSRGA
jgi:hypothetical protein